MWCFVDSKQQEKWIWGAICRRTRQLVGWCVGDRSQESCERLKEAIDPAYQHCDTASDKWPTYEAVFEPQKHVSAFKESGLTAHIERFWNQVRQRLGRFVRKTLSFSRSARWLVIQFWSFVESYNLSLAVKCG